MLTPVLDSAANTIAHQNQIQSTRASVRSYIVPAHRFQQNQYSAANNISTIQSAGSNSGNPDDAQTLKYLKELARIVRTRVEDL